MQRVSAGLTRDEQETVVVTGADGVMHIDTTIPREIRDLINKDYTIEGLTYCGDRLIGAKFSGAARQLTFRNTRKTLKSED